MIAQKAFNNKIKKMISELPNSGFIEYIEKLKVNSSKSYYEIFDNLSYKYGFDFNADEIANPKTNKIVGYLPYLVYYAHNSSENKLVLEDSPLSLKLCYELLAKKVFKNIQKKFKESNLIKN